MLEKVQEFSEIANEFRDFIQCFFPSDGNTNNNHILSSPLFT
jgi:hypothetical protein